MKRLTTEEFIKKAKILHGNKYNYSKSIYNGALNKITIICPTHQEFHQTASSHLSGIGCRKCGSERTSEKLKLTTEEFIKQSDIIHNSFYSYVKTKYINGKDKIIITCPNHGDFYQSPTTHLKGSGCVSCSRINGGAKRQKTTEEFIKESKKIHGNRFDYSVTIYTHAHAKCKFICPVHGIFEQSISSHLKGNGCSKCGYGKMKISKEEYLDRFKKIHGDKYNYDLVTNAYSQEKIKIICRIHGLFEQTINSHVQGKGCAKCANFNLTRDEIISKFRTVHQDFYDYSKMEYKNSNTPIQIICPFHGDFLQIPSDHLSKSCGCPQCGNKNNLSETRLLNLVKYSFNFSDVKYIFKFKWLGRMSLDIYLPEYNLAIEHQGKQHFKAVPFFGGENSFIKTLDRDERKRRLCKDNGCTLLYFTYQPEHIPKDYPHKVFTSESELLEVIRSHISSFNSAAAIDYQI